MTTIEDTAIAAPPKKFIIEPRKAMMFITRKKITIPFLSAMTPLSETDGVLISLDASTIMIMPKIIMSTPATMTTAVMTLPAVAAPVAAYVPAVIDRGVVRTSGQIPVVNGEPVCIGAVGEDGADPEDAKDAARVCALNALAAAASVAGGIDNLAGVVKVVGFVSSRPDFYGQAGVINGASELFGEIFGSQHARSAVGVAALPLNVSVEVEAEFLIK